MKRVLAILAGLAAPLTAHAVSITQYGWTCEGFVRCGASADAVTIITISVINSIFNIITALSVIMFIYGGIRIATSRGEEAKETGKKAIMYAAIGLALAVLTYGGNRIIIFVMDLVSSVA